MRAWTVLLVAAALAGCGRRLTQAEAGRASRTLYVGNAAEPADLDPGIIYAQTDANIVYALFEPLVNVVEPTTQPVPAAAASWDISPDGRVYTFHLRKNGRWSDGMPVTADDFVYGMRRVLTPAYGASYSYMLWPIRNAEAFNEGKLADFDAVGIHALDPYTLQITLESPAPYVLGMASHQTWMAVPRHVIERFGGVLGKGTRWTRAGNLVGNGPFVLKEWTPNSRIVVARNPRYWDAGHVRLNRIVFYPIEDADSEEMDFRAGQLDITFSLPVSRLEFYRRERPQDLQTEAWLSTYYIFVNVRKPPFDNVKLRQALAAGIDRVAICQDALRGTYTPASSFCPPDIGGYTCVARQPSDFVLARRLLAEAGYPGGRGLPPIEILIYQSQTSALMIEAIQAQWARELGVHVSILPQEQKTLFQNSQSGNYSLAHSAWVADYADPYTFLGTMTTGNGNNWAGWSNREYDRLIDDSCQTADQARRFADFQRAEAILLREAPLLLIGHYNHTYLQRTFVRGYPPSRLAFHRWKNVWLAADSAP